MRWSRLLLLALLPWLGGCESTAYYLQSAGGQLRLLGQARDIPQLLEDPQVAGALKQRLGRVGQIRAFAVDSLGLPDNASYSRYAEVGREALVWSVVATPELALEPRQWCYPVIGCASYRGYFDAQRAQEYADVLAQQGWDVAVEPVPAYSTLGWFSDPLPSTVIDWPEAQLAGLIFHELAHQRLYARDDSTFNESYATVVEHEGVRRWLARQPDAAAQLVDWEQGRVRAGQFRAMLAATRQGLAALYAGPGEQQQKLARKVTLFTGLRSAYAELKREWDGYPGYDRWMGRDLNNAHLASVQTYSLWVPALRQLLSRLDGDLLAFHAQCARLAALPADRRSEELRELVNAPNRDAVR